MILEAMRQRDQEEEKMLTASLLFFLKYMKEHNDLYVILNNGRLNITNPDSELKSLKFQQKIQKKSIKNVLVLWKKR